MQGPTTNGLTRRSMLGASAALAGSAALPAGARAAAPERIEASANQAIPWPGRPRPFAPIRWWPGR